MARDTTVAARPLTDANQFTIDGPIRITYASTSITGAPLFSYQDAEVDLDFRGDDITRVDTALGELVTVTVQTVPDAFARTITLVVPTVRVAMGEQAEFSTVVVETVDRSGAFVRPPGPAGAAQTYQIHQVHGSAEHVVS
ncbi:hypothetical protein AB0F72_41035 [Actinoplanes sp. NPDC023936]|uniref:hypothetical protein n=1 Tax=Actinoplanes sp. NPDC023936 TaxID=3154910 RepID=UPI0033F66A39